MRCEVEMLTRLSHVVLLYYCSTEILYCTVGQYYCTTVLVMVVICPFGKLEPVPWSQPVIVYCEIPHGKGSHPNL